MKKIILNLVINKHQCRFTCPINILVNNNFLYSKKTGKKI